MWWSKNVKIEGKKSFSLSGKIKKFSQLISGFCGGTKNVENEIVEARILYGDVSKSDSMRLQ